ncbi:hypothetical protein IW261DRAFT_1414769 [Armillaria novae-zelandiae]|uniref:Uncharacterized protein n=1 Tax=Armillaria novae-zelandiae TaxID=153914 RepID=A0AA39URA0_9AGAR|nr:hypothetical protein IW261DRAFT_1414769 [Armillaria novae-zelandiae]
MYAYHRCHGLARKPHASLPPTYYPEPHVKLEDALALILVIGIGGRSLGGVVRSCDLRDEKAPPVTKIRWPTSAGRVFGCREPVCCVGVVMAQVTNVAAGAFGQQSKILYESWLYIVCGEVRVLKLRPTEWVTRLVFYGKYLQTCLLDLEDLDPEVVMGSLRRWAANRRFPANRMERSQIILERGPRRRHVPPYLDFKRAQVPSVAAVSLVSKYPPHSGTTLVARVEDEGERGDLRPEECSAGAVAPEFLRARELCSTMMIRSNTSFVERRALGSLWDHYGAVGFQQTGWNVVRLYWREDLGDATFPLQYDKDVRLGGKGGGAFEVFTDTHNTDKRRRTAIRGSHLRKRPPSSLPGGSASKREIEVGSSGWIIVAKVKAQSVDDPKMAERAAGHQDRDSGDAVKGKAALGVLWPPTTARSGKKSDLQEKPVLRAKHETNAPQKRRDHQQQKLSGYRKSIRTSSRAIPGFGPAKRFSVQSVLCFFATERYQLLLGPITLLRRRASCESGFVAGSAVRVMMDTLQSNICRCNETGYAVFICGFELESRLAEEQTNERRCQKEGDSLSGGVLVVDTTRQWQEQNDGKGNVEALLSRLAIQMNVHFNARSVPFSGESKQRYISKSDAARMWSILWNSHRHTLSQCPLSASAPPSLHGYAPHVPEKRFS